MDVRELNISADEAEKIQQKGTGETNATLFGHSEQMDSKKESTRSTIALVYVLFFVGIIGGAFATGMRENLSISDIKDILLAISGVLSGPLGFIIGHYFKTSNN